MLGIWNNSQTSSKMHWIKRFNRNECQGWTTGRKLEGDLLKCQTQKGEVSYWPVLYRNQVRSHDLGQDKGTNWQGEGAFPKQSWQKKDMTRTWWTTLSVPLQLPPVRLSPSSCCFWPSPNLMTYHFPPKSFAHIPLPHFIWLIPTDVLLPRV